MLKLNKKLLPFILLGIISAAIFLYLQKNKESLSLLFNLTPYSICILVLCSLAVKLIIGFIYKVLMCFFDLKLVFKEWFGLTSISMMANYFLPAKGGLVALAVYLKKVHNFTYTMFLSSAAGFHGVSFLINAVVGIGLSAFVFRKEVLNAKILFVFFITIITVIYIVFLCIRYLSKLKKKWPLLQRFVDGFANFRKKPDLMFKLVLFQLALLMMAGVHSSF